MSTPAPTTDDLERVAKVAAAAYRFAHAFVRYEELYAAVAEAMGVVLPPRPDCAPWCASQEHAGHTGSTT